MANRHMKRCSVLLIIREIQIKATKSYYHPPVKMAIIKNNKNNNVGDNVEKRQPLHTVGINVNWKTVRWFLKKLKTELPYDPAIPFLVYIKKKKNSQIQRYTNSKKIHIP